MRTRDDALVYQEAQSSDKSSKTWDLKYTDPLSALYLEFEAVNGTTENKGNFLSDVITKIEIVDGSKPLYSLTQHELEALHFYKLKQMPALFPSEWASGSQRHGVLLMLGRKLWDTDFALDCKQYKNPQLKISWDLGAVRTVSATTAFATGTLKISAIAKIIEEIGAPGKFLSAREVDAFTMPTSGNHPTEMYTDFPWRLLMLKSFLQSSDIDECISYIKLNCDAGKFIPLDNRYVKQLDAEALTLFGEGRLKHDVLRSSGDHTRLLFNKEPNIAYSLGAENIKNFIAAGDLWSSDWHGFQYDADGNAESTDRKLTGVEGGHALHATLPIPFGDMDKPETWFDATKYGRIDLTMYAPASGAAGISSVVLEQVRPNGQ